VGSFGEEGKYVPLPGLYPRTAHIHWLTSN